VVFTGMYPCAVVTHSFDYPRAGSVIRRYEICNLIARSRVNFSSVSSNVPGLAARGIWVSTLSSGFVKGHGADVGTNTFRDTKIAPFIIQRAEKVRPPACISIADKPAVRA